MLGITAGPPQSARLVLGSVVRPRRAAPGIGDGPARPAAASASAITVRTLGWARGPADLRDRERVRRDVHVPRPAPAQSRRGRPLPVPQGRQLGAQQQRLPPQRRPALPRRRQPPGVRHARVRRRHRAGHPRQGGGAGARGAAARRRAAAPRRGHRRRHLPVQEQHRLGRQLLRLPRELPGRPVRRVQPAGGRADPVPGDPADRRRRRQGHPDARAVRRTASASAPSTSGRASAARPRAAARSSTPATSRTPTPRSTGGCTSSSATPT